MSDVATIGLDLAKSVFQIHGVDAVGRMILRRRLSRHELVPYFAKLSPCLIGMEACSAAHHWARELSRFGHPVRLIPPQYAKPYVKRNKTDAADAEAICEAVARPNMRYVPIKTLDQQSVLSLHSVRALFVRQRTAAINTVRGLLTEFGIIAGKGIGRIGELRRRANEADGDALPAEARATITEVFEHIDTLTGRIDATEAKILAWHKNSEAASADPSVVVPVRGKEDADFVPIGVFARAEDEGPAVMAEASPLPAARLPSRDASALCPKMAERVGVIEIELADGTRLLVDAFVNERALRRVLAALKAAGA